MHPIYCDIYFVLPSAFDILQYIFFCRAIPIYDLPINLRYIYKRVSPLIAMHAHCALHSLNSCCAEHQILLAISLALYVALDMEYCSVLLNPSTALHSHSVNVTLPVKFLGRPFCDQRWLLTQILETQVADSYMHRR